MKLSGEQVLLRVYLQSADRAPHAPSYERLVHVARDERLAGATVLKGILGVGHHGVLHASAWALVEHVPVIVEIVDTAQRIGDFMNGPMARVMTHGMATLERAHVMTYRHGAGDPDGGPLRVAPAARPLANLPNLLPRGNMTIDETGVLLRVFIGESDRHQGKPLYEAIVQKAREIGLAGATVLRGVEGFGANSVVHKAALLEMSTDLPIVVELVDTGEKIQTLLPQLEKMVDEGMITMEHVAIIVYRHNPADGPA